MTQDVTVPEWAKTLPEELHTAPHLATSETIEQWRDHIANDAAWKGNSIRIPGPDASPEDIQAFQQKTIERIPGLMPVPDPDNPDNIRQVLSRIGMPDEASKYKVPEGVDLGEAVGSLKAQALEWGLTQKQFDNYVSNLSAQQIAQAEQQQTWAAEQMTAVKKDWGAAADERIALVKQFLEHDPEVPKELLTQFNQGTLSADTMRWLYKTADKVEGEASNSEQQRTTRSGKLSPSEALEQLGEVERRIYTPGAQSDPMYGGWVNKRNELMLLAYPE